MKTIARTAARTADRTKLSLPAAGLQLGPLVRMVRYLSPNQVMARLDYRARVMYYRSPLYGFIEHELEVPDAPILKAPDLWAGSPERGRGIQQHTFTFVGRTINMGKSVQWLPAGASPLWLFNLHYFDWLADLKAVGTADALTHARDLVNDWIENFGDFHRLCWHPYPLSCRLVNWLTHAHWLLEGADGGFRERFMHSLVRQSNHIAKVLEWDVGGNHLLKNIKALIYTSLCLPGRQSTYLEAEDLLREQLQLQILPDGAHYELSPLYHAQVLQDLLDIHALILKAGQTPLPELDGIIDRMAVVLAFYRHPDGGLALFNDSAEGDVDLLDALQERCGLADSIPAELPYAGYVRMDAGDTTVLMDCGRCCPDNLPGHAHADTLSFELSWQAQRVFVNSGTYAYQHESRNKFRGTAAHNTLTVNREDSAEVWNAFRLGRRPMRVKSQVREEPGTGIGVEASHDGYRHLKAMHTRRLFLNAEGDDLRGEDTVTAPKELPVSAHFHLHPRMKYKLLSNREAELTTPEGQVFSFRIKGGQLHDQDAQYSPQFGVLEPTRKLVVRGSWQEGKCVINWALRAQAPEGKA